VRFIAVAGLLLTAPVFAAKPQIQWNPAFDFTEVSTFMWQPSAGESLAVTQPFLHEHIINAIEYQLTASGLREVSADADIVVTYYGSTETNYRLQSDAYGYGFGGYGGVGWRYYGSPYVYPYGSSLGAVSTTTTVSQYETGTLVIDIVDADESQLVWRGVASGLSVSNNLSRMQAAIDKAIRRMVKQTQKLRQRAGR
jgi:hypothetical protein